MIELKNLLVAWRNSISSHFFTRGNQRLSAIEKESGLNRSRIQPSLACFVIDSVEVSAIKHGCVRHPSASGRDPQSMCGFTPVDF
ncbi:hypothetical protein [Rhodopirellula halodulae]|uniref:hypothetical protein n=1 Tax=Rhodopirellula halodulae TaxID=2894198 RepID=UPI001E3D2D06|nr:hypothetical protein [Rhodopirellula sp. JC737]MCC9655346.1 hypothetical protein [Rhodopirellula sp. JC737]